MNAPETHVHRWGKVAVFDGAAPAHQLAEHLQKAGFAARVYDERKLQKYWFLARPVAGLQVQVPEHAVDAALEFLGRGPEAERLLRPAIRCPSCRSTLVHYPQMTRKNVLPTIVSHFLVAARLMHHEYYCEECHLTWTRGQQHAASRRAPSLGASR